MPRHVVESLVATALGLVAIVLAVTALSDQFVIEGTSESNYLQWATRPLFFFALGGIAAAVLMLILAIRQASSTTVITAAIGCVALLAAGGAVDLDRRHPVGHERSILAGFELPASYGAEASYQPYVDNGLPGDIDPPSIVATYSFPRNSSACADLRTAFDHIADERSNSPGVGIGQVGGVSCSYLGEHGGWPVIAEVDVPQPNADYEVPSSTGGIPAAPAAGMERIDVYVQPPDGD